MRGLATVGGKNTRNMVAVETDLPDAFAPGTKNSDNTGVDMDTTRDFKWVGKPGKGTYGTPTIAGGKVFIATNNGSPRDARVAEDREILMCFDENSGKFLWRSDFTAELDVWPQDASDCSPLVDEDLVYVCTSDDVDLSHRRIPSSEAPSLIALDKALKLG
jgi:outer membrane protein assembly factor BamB